MPLETFKMADAVTAILERMVPELEELQERGIFTPAEVKSIVRKRSDLEYGLKKRAVTPEDFVRALEYELNLEALRRRRKAQLGLRRVTESDHAGIRRIHFIFDRAVRRFRMDVRWWLQWADFCMRSRSTKAVDRVFGRALMLHSRCEELWLQAAAWQFDRMQQYATARALMQRALRANKLSPRLWTSYFQLELVYVMRVLGRRLALGLHELPEGPSSSRLIADEGLLERAAGSAARAGGEDSDEGEAADAATAALDSLATDADDAELPGGDGGGGDDGLFSAPAFGDVPDAPLPATAEAGAAAAPAADPRAAFFKGMVPRIIYDSAIALLPRDLRLRLAMLRACDACTTLAAGGGAPLPAFPDLAAYIVASIAADFSADPATWELLAGRAFEGVEATAARRAAALAEAGVSAGIAGDSELGTVAGRTGAAIPASELSDDALFVVDSRTRQHEPASEEVLATGSDAAPTERAAADRPPTSDKPAACLPSPALGCPEVYAGEVPAQATAAWLGSLATGSFDEAIAAAFIGALGPQPKRLGSAEPVAVASPAAALVLPALAQPLWRAAVEGGGGSASAGPTGGSKRKRASAAPSIDAPSLQMGAAAGAPASAVAVRLVAATRSEPAAAVDAELTAWAAAVDGTVLGLVKSALAAAAAAAGSGGHARLAILRMTRMASGVLCRLLRLPLSHSAAAGRRTAGLLRELEALACTALDAAEAAVAPGSSAAAPAESPAAAAVAAETAWLLGACASLGVQAALRLGLLRDSASLALRTAGLAGALQAPVLAVLPAALSFHLRAARAQLEKDGASSDAVAAALSRARGNDDETVCPATTLAALLPTGGEAMLSAPSALLGAAAAASPRAPHVVEVFLCLLAAAAANEGDAAPALLSSRRSRSAPAAAWAPVERTSPIFERALLAGLPKPAETRVRSAYLDAVEWCSERYGTQRRFEEQWVAFSLAAIKRSAVAEVCERVLGAVAAVAAASPLPPDSEARCRREFEAAVASHGGTSAKLWAAFVRFERALLQRGGGAAAAAAPGSQRRPVLRDAASVVHERAARTLLPGPAQEAWHALQREL